MRMIFQDPDSSLNPRLPVRDIVAEPLTLSRTVRGRREVDERVRTLLAVVGLNPDHITAIRTRSAVASASASAWRARWRWTPS